MAKNILFLMMDHTNREALSPDSPCLTPNLDKIAAQGTRFSRCYTTNAICSPARASLMTGLFPSAHGMWDCTHTQRKEWVDVPVDRFGYFSQHLADGGYHTGYFGKWHVEQSNKLEDFGWQEYKLCGRAAMGERIPEHDVVVKKEGYRDYVMAGVGQEQEPRHPAFEKAIDFLKRHANDKAGDPFCCFVSAIEPHDTYVPPERFYKLYDRDSIPLPPTLRTDPEGKPDIVRRMRSVWLSMTDEDWRQTRLCYWATITYIDHEIGRLMQVLKDLDLEDDTIIVFTSDHGDMLGAHGLATKGVGTSYEEVYNIPLIIRVPGQTPSEDSTTLTSLVDIAPTILDYCGLAPMSDIHGQSLRPVIDDADAADRRFAYAEFFGQRFVYTQRIVWQDDWKYVFSPGGIDELYDLASDPHETTNLAQDPTHENRLRAMVKRMWQQMRDIGDNSLFNTQYATLRTAPIGPGCLDEE